MGWSDPVQRLGEWKSFLYHVFVVQLEEWHQERHGSKAVGCLSRKTCRQEATQRLSNQEMGHILPTEFFVYFPCECEQIVHNDSSALEHTTASLTVAESSLIHRIEVVPVFCESLGEVSIATCVVAVPV